jgi:ribose-phosphate pyrophosphokinase
MKITFHLVKINKMKKIIFNTSDYKYLAHKVLELGEFEKGELETNTFSDGERYQRILSQVENRNVILIGGTVNDSATLELYDLASALVSYGANSLSLVVPYFGYSTMERAVATGEVVTAKTRARLLSSIPRSNKGNHIYLFDLHTEGLPHYFERNLFPIHLYCKELIIEACREFGGDDFVLASTDAGRAKWVESLANDMHVNAAFVLKRRLQGDKTEVNAVNADVEGKNVIIYDDMIRSGGSIINAAKTYKNAGANKIFVITSHGLFVNNGLEKIKNSNMQDSSHKCNTIFK